MDQGASHTEILIARALAGEATSAEIAELAAWRSQSESNESVYQDTLKVLSTLGQPEFAPDIDAAWKKLDARITSGEPKVISLFNRKNFRYAAAALLITAGIATFTYLSGNRSGQEMLVAAVDRPQEMQLPDGSTVRVSEHSRVNYKTADGVRHAELEGEAFFEVVHDEDEPFVVMAGDVLIKDLGTAFNVRALPGAATTEVFVESGEVQFYTSENEGLKLTKGERAVFNRSSGEFRKLPSAATNNLRDFRTRAFTFTNSRLKDVVNELNTVYGSNIVLADERISNCRLSVSFRNEPLEVVIQVIRETLDLETKMSGDTLILNGNGCE